MKYLNLLCFLIICNFCSAQEMVFRVPLQKGNPWLRFMRESATSMGQYITGNMYIYDKGKHNSTQPIFDYFMVYTTDQINSKLNSERNEYDKKIMNLQSSIDSSVNMLSKLLIENVDTIKSQVKVEATNELKTFMETLIKSEVDKLRSDLQNQLDELKKKVENKPK